MERAIGLLYLSLLALAAPTMSGDTSAFVPSRASVQAVAFEGEELVYEVSWTIFKLGTIRIRLGVDGNAEARIDSYEGLSVVDLHSVQFSVMDSLFFSRACRSLDKREEVWAGLNYEYDIPGRRLVVHEMVQKDLKGTPENVRARDTIALASPHFIDGLSIAYFPRAFIHTARTVQVPTVLYGKMGVTTFYFTRERTTETIDAVEGDIRVIEVHGNTSVEGIFGMTGDFTGWFSDDAAAVPIKGKLEVLIGSVTVELVGWKRGSWSPPLE